MTGKFLYELWLRKLDEFQNCTADSWEALNLDDQEVWDAMAEELSSR